jgi:hypothetical protein
VSIEKREVKGERPAPGTLNLSASSRGEPLCTPSFPQKLAAADKEICDSILKTWLFKPNLSGTFELPLAINAAKTVRYKSVMH